MRRIQGLTLIEILVVMVIFTILSGGIYYLLKEMNVKRAIGEARMTAQREAGKILSQMQKDFAGAKQGTFNALDVNNISFKMGVGKVGQEATVSYEYKKPYLTRKLNNTMQWIMAQNLDQLNVSKQVATGQLLLEVKTKVAIDGLTIDRAQSHEQNMVVVMRAASSIENDPHWRDVGDSAGVFTTSGSLINGAGQDWEHLFENAQNQLGELVNNPVGVDLAAGVPKPDIGAKLAESYNKILTQLDALNQQIISCGEAGIMETHWYDVNPTKSRENEIAREMRLALYNQNTRSTMNFDPIRALALNGGCGSRVKETLPSMYNGKVSLMNAGYNLLQNIEKARANGITVNTPRTEIFN